MRQTFSLENFFRNPIIPKEPKIIFVTNENQYRPRVMHPTLRGDVHIPSRLLPIQNNSESVIKFRFVDLPNQLFLT